MGEAVSFGGGRGGGAGKEGREVGSGALRGGRGWGRGKGLSFFCLRGREGGEGSGGGGERHLFLKLREVWEEAFSVPSPFFLLRGCLRGGWGGWEGVWVKSWKVVWVL